MKGANVLNMPIQLGYLRAICAMACLLHLWAGDAVAQDQEPTAEHPLDGDQSIRAEDPPVSQWSQAACLREVNRLVIEADEISMSGAATADELLRKLPYVTFQGETKQNNDGGQGLARIDLRNLGTYRTLVLINGRRMISAFGSGVDLNTIPIGVIDRVEITLESASIRYGSSAMAGVVNFVIGKDHQGFSAALQGGVTTHGDGENVLASATLGGTHDHGHAVVHLSYYRRNDIRERDREWAQPPVAWEYYDDIDGDGMVDRAPFRRMYGSGYTPGGRLFSYSNAFPSMHLNPDGSFTPFSNGMEPGNPYGHRYNYGRDHWLVGRMDRVSVTALGDYALTDWVTAYAEGDITFLNNLNQISPQPVGLSSIYQPAGPLELPLTNPYIPDSLTELEAEGDVGYFGMSRRMSEVGRRVYENNRMTFRTVVGLRGNWGENFYWDSYLNYSKMFNAGTLHNAVNLTNLYTALDPDLCAEDVLCPGIANLVGAGNLQDDVAAYIRFKQQHQAMREMVQTGLSVTGRLFRLPGGYMSTAVGGELRWQRGHFLPDDRVVTGEAAQPIVAPYAGDFTVQAGFAELVFPFLADLPGVKLLSLDLAARLTNFSTFGSQFDYRIGLAWKPITAIALRGSYTTAFRAPGISDLYSGKGRTIRLVHDPCNYWEDSTDTTLRENCRHDGVPGEWVQGPVAIITDVGANPNLGAETSSQFSLGTTIRPGFVPPRFGVLSLRFNYFEIDVTNGFGELDAQTIVNKCYLSSNKSHQYCQYIGARSPGSDISKINLITDNVMETQSSGLDFSIDYGLPISPKLRAEVTFFGSVLLELQQTDTVAEITDDLLGTVNGSFAGAIPKFRCLADVALNGAIWRVSNRLRYTGPVEVFQWDAGTPNDWTDDLPTRDIDGIAYWDIAASLIWQGLDFVVGIDNIIDSSPPYIPGSTANSNAQSYDFMGRYIYGKIGTRF